MSRLDRIEARLREVFTPSRLEVRDDSEAHRGHSGFQEGGESHFSITIRAEAFSGMSRVARHRAVHTALGQDLIGEIHALALDIDS